MQGMYDKYFIIKKETGTLVEGAFVLAPDRDPIALIALKVYAENTPDDKLREDLLEWISLIEK